LNVAEIQNFFKSIEKKKILVIGDVMIDAYIWGRVERISPEAPVPIVTCTKQEHRLGGAANVALNLQSLGCIPILSGIIGNDDNGTIFLKLLQNLRLANDGIYIVRDRKTTIKTRIISGNQQLIRIDDETSTPLIGKNEQDYIKHLNKILESTNFDAIIFQDYDKGSITPNIIDKVVQWSEEKKIPVLVDPKKRNFNNYHNVTLFKPNFKEFCEGISRELKKEDINSIVQHSAAFIKEKKIKYLLVTLSEKGVLIVDDKNSHYIPAHVRDIADVSGAGDTVISVASLCLAYGMDSYMVAAISNLAGGIVCEKVGVVPITKEMLARELEIKEIF